LERKRVEEAEKKLDKENYHVMELTEDYWIFIMFLKFKCFRDEKIKHWIDLNPDEVKNVYLSATFVENKNKKTLSP